MTITGGTALGKDEVDRMVADAERFASEDHARREVAEARNEADQLTYQVDRFVEENTDKIADGDRAELVQSNDELKQVLKGDDATADALRSATQSVMQVFQRVGQAMVQQQQQQQQQQQAQSAQPSGTGEPAADASPEGSDDDVVEGEIVDEGDAS